MATLNYKSILSRFCTQAKAYKLATYPEDVVTELTNEWIHSVAGQVSVRRMFKSISLDDEIQQITYALKNSVDSESDDDFVSNIFAMGVGIRWAKAKLCDDNVLDQAFLSQEVKFYSQKNHMDGLRDLLKDLKTELNSEITSHNGTWNSYLKKGDK